MKKKFLFLMLAALGLSANAKDIKTMVVTTTPQMHCAACEKTIKDGLKFEKGVKEITTSIPDQTVTVNYDADKTSAEKLVKAFGECGYEVKFVNAGEKVAPHEGEKCPVKDM